MAFYNQSFYNQGYYDYESDSEWQLEELLDNYSYIFRATIHSLPYISYSVAEIRTQTSTPIYTNARKYPMHYAQELDNYIYELLKAGVIRPSQSPYNSPLWISLGKPNNAGERKLMIVVDYKNLNSVTIPDKHPIPNINSILAQLGNNIYFSVLKLKDGFHQILLKESDIEKTAFTTHNGRYEFTRLPLGLRNSMAIFQRTLENVLFDHIGNICYVYIGNIIVFSQDMESHIDNLEMIFETLSDSNVLCDVERCEFLKTRINISGFVISSKGIETNKYKVQRIANYRRPKTLKSLKSFLGLSCFYKRFIKDYAKLAKPLTILLAGHGGIVRKKYSKNIPINLNQDAVKAFNKLKSILMNDRVVLKFPDFINPFNLWTNTCRYSIGAVLCQDKQPITFLSRTLSKAEERYSDNEKEMLAIVWALQRLKFYKLENSWINIFTDYEPVSWRGNARGKRWQAILNNYNYGLFYKVVVNPSDFI